MCPTRAGPTLFASHSRLPTPVVSSSLWGRDGEKTPLLIWSSALLEASLHGCASRLGFDGFTAQPPGYAMKHLVGWKKKNLMHRRMHRFLDFSMSGGIFTGRVESGKQTPTSAVL